MSKSLKKLIDINRLREFKNKLVGTGSAYVQTGEVDQTVGGTKAFSKPIVGSVTGSSGSCTGNAATATRADSAASADTATNANYANSAGSVAWGNVSGRPTAVSQFSNDSGYITTDGAAYPRRVGGVTMNFNWSGRGGQPTWLWGGEDGTNMYVYNPANFSVNYADSAGNGVPAGAIIPFAGTSVPTGYLLCNGAAVSRTNYANLFAAIGTRYGAGNGSTTFNLPDARDRVLQGASGWHSVGSYIAAGLPNITGGVGNGGEFYCYGSSTGAFSVDWSGSAHNTGSGPALHGSFSFNAQKSNALYGASSTVQMAAVATNFIIKY